jgi:hypothetical protein
MGISTALRARRADRYNARMTKLPLRRCVRAAAEAATSAGALLARHMGEATSVTTKRSVVDLVTEIDRASELLIRRRLAHAFPAFGFLGEEHGHHREGAGARWIVDRSSASRSPWRPRAGSSRASSTTRCAGSSTRRPAGTGRS